MKAEAFDKAFDEGKDITGELDLDSLERPNREAQRIDLDLPKWMVDSIDRTAARLNESRETVIKIWLADRLEATLSDNSGDE